MIINIILGILISSLFLVFYMLYIIKKDIFALHQTLKNNENFFLNNLKTVEEKIKDKQTNASLEPFHLKQTILELEKRVDLQTAKLLQITKNVKKK